MLVVGESIIADAWARKDAGLCLTPNCGWQVHAGEEFCNNCLVDIQTQGQWNGDAWEHYQRLKAAIEAERLLKAGKERPND